MRLSWINEVFDAYNRDLEENPDVFIRRDGRLLAQVRVELGTDEWTDSRYLEVFEEMHHTVEALCRLGFDDYVMPPLPEEVGEIRLGVHDWNEEKSPLERARETYRVYDGNTEGEEAIFFSEDVFVMEETGEEILVSVTDPAEIEELLELFSFAERRQSISVFCRKQDASGATVVVPDRNIPSVAALFARLRNETGHGHCFMNGSGAAVFVGRRTLPAETFDVRF